MTETSSSAQIWRIWNEDVRAPSPAVLKLQAELMKKAFTRAEKAKIPGLTLGFAQQRAALKLAVGNSIWSRVEACRKPDEYNNPKECGIVFCPYCLLLRRRRQTAENLRLFRHLGNQKLAFMTVLVKVVHNLETATKLKSDFALRIRNAIETKRRSDPRWDDVMVKGYWEFEHFKDTDELGYNQGVALPHLNYPAIAYGYTVWLFHLHAIVALGDVPLDDFKEAIRGKGMDKPYQVDVRPFDASHDVVWNIKRITRYAMKFRIEDDYKRTGPFDPNYEFDMDASNERKWWPREDVGSLASYLSEKRRGFRFMQFWIGAKGISKKATGIATSGPATNVVSPKKENQWKGDTSHFDLLKKNLQSKK